MAFMLAEPLVEKVCELALQQAGNRLSIIYNFREDFELLERRFREINCVLNEAEEESSSQRESVKNWLHRVGEIAWEAEDILEEFAVDSMYARNTQLCYLSCTQLILRLNIGKRIQKVKARLESVVSDGNQLNIVRALAVPRRQEAGESSTSLVKQFRRTSILPSDSKPVAIESKIGSIVSLLENPKTSIIAVVGMGGVGKTYLLQHVYNGRKDRYDKSAWLSVSRFYSVSKLQHDLAFQLDKDLSKEINEGGVSEVLAEELIYRFMSGKRCLIVLDDVWRAAREESLLTKLGIPVGDNSQCKTLVSTRSREVCVNLKAEIYVMEFLTEEESWKLFCAYAFPQCEENRAPEKLEKVARKIENNCGKLPLAIKVIAASLERTVEVSEWESMLHKLKKVGTSKDHDYVMDILKLSYNSLPAYLKACFAYFSIFPEDEKIDCEYLMYLWMGEGFILATQNPWECLHQLANLCLVEVWEDLDIQRCTKFCRMHDLLLDLAIVISQENKCAFKLEDAFSRLHSHSVNTGGVRWCRLFLAKRDIDDDAISQMRPLSPTLVRTLSLSSNPGIERNIPSRLISGMRVLRVLDLSYTNISTLPASVGEMKLLKVLNLRWTRIRNVPECVRKLKSLSYLNVSSEDSLGVAPEIAPKIAPKWIGELRCLQHLEGWFVRLPKGIMKVGSLRTLRTEPLILSCKRTCMQWCGLRLEDVGKMTENLEEISFIVSEESQLKRIEEGILAPFKKMRRLTILNESKLHLPQFPETMNAMKDLEYLRLGSFAVPGWICCLTNLVSLSLAEENRCRELPEAFGKSGGFPHLRKFKIWNFHKLEEFPEIEDGAMPCLEELEIMLCHKLNKGGEGMERLKRLKRLDITLSGTMEWRETFKEGGINWAKIKALNPQVIINEGDFFSKNRGNGVVETVLFEYYQYLRNRAMEGDD